MTNPYETPRNESAFPRGPVRNHRIIAYTMAGFSMIIGWIHLRPLLSSPLTSWGWQNWWFGFIPAGYLVVIAVLGVVCERRAQRIGYLWLPVFQLPLLLVTALIGFATYIDFPNLMSGKYGLTQNLHSLLLVAVCPVIWCYLLVATIRSYRVFRKEARVLGSGDQKE